ncbi:MAG: DUF3558 family protein [Pseudonocardiales bacterium]
MKLGAAVVVAAGLLAGGCSWQVLGSSAPPAVADASGVDMCTILSDVELSELGIKLDTRQQVDELGVIGCQWVGRPFTLVLERDEDTIAEYVSRQGDPAFVFFDENTVNGRAGVHLGVEGDGTDCAQLIDGGSVSLTVAVAPSSTLAPPIDACAEAMRIARLIEPRLPKAGS